MADNAKCRIVSVEELNPFSPILVNFEFGFNSKFERSGLKCGVYVDNDNKEEKTVIIQKEDRHFVGRLPSNELSQTLLLVRNRRTNEARIFVTQSCTLMDSSREEENLKRKRERKESEGLIDLKKAWGKEHKLRLSFGSKRSIRASNVNMRLHTDIQTDKNGLKEAVSDVKVNLSDINNTNQADNDILKLLPPCNRKASNKNEVYKVEDLLSNEELESLMPAAEFLINNSLTEMDEKNSFFLYSHYKQLGSNPDPSKIALLLYGSSLLKFYTMKLFEIRESTCLQKICPQSRIIASKIMNEFTELVNKLRTRPSFNKDKIVCYVIILVLLACDFRVDGEILSTCFKGIGQKKLAQLIKVVGLKRGKDRSSTYYLILPLPPLPQVRAPRKTK